MKSENVRPVLQNGQYSNKLIDVCHLNLVLISICFLRNIAILQIKGQFSNSLLVKHTYKVGTLQFVNFNNSNLFELFRVVLILYFHFLISKRIIFQFVSHVHLKKNVFVFVHLFVDITISISMQNFDSVHVIV